MKNNFYQLENENPDDKELSSFTKIIKNYLETSAKSDLILDKCLDHSNKSYKMCEKWITNYVKNSITQKNGCQIGVLSDNECYTLMKEFFLDGVFALKMQEENENLRMQQEKRNLEEAKKQKAEEVKRHEKQWENFLQNTECNLSASELDRQKIKHAKEQNLFDF